MNLKKGFLRIYLVLAFLWSLFYSYIAYDSETFPLYPLNVIIVIFLPIPVYYVLRWIINGFDK